MEELSGAIPRTGQAKTCPHSAWFWPSLTAWRANDYPVGRASRAIAFSLQGPVIPAFAGIQRLNPAIGSPNGTQGIKSQRAATPAPGLPEVVTARLNLNPSYLGRGEKPTAGRPRTWETASRTLVPGDRGSLPRKPGPVHPRPRLSAPGMGLPVPPGSAPFACPG